MKGRDRETKETAQKDKKEEIKGGGKKPKMRWGRREKQWGNRGGKK